MAKALGFWRSTALVVGNMIGSGVFLLPASLAAYGGISILGWLFTATGAMLLALVFAHLGRTVPRAGGVYAYTRIGFGDFAALESSIGEVSRIGRHFPHRPKEGAPRSDAAGPSHIARGQSLEAPEEGAIAAAHQIEEPVARSEGEELQAISPGGRETIYFQHLPRHFFCANIYCLWLPDKNGRYTECWVMPGRLTQAT